MRLTLPDPTASASTIEIFVEFHFNSTSKPVLTIVIGVPFVVNGILITGTLETVIGLDVVIIVILAGGGVGYITGSILTHFAPVDADPA